MWIKSFKRRYRRVLVDKVTQVTNTHGQTKDIVDQEWSLRRIWVEVDVWVGKKKYQKKPEHCKKVLSDDEIDKRHWKASKRNKRCKWTRSAPKWIMRHSNKMHRQWERRCIEKEDYDQLGSKWQRRDFFDPWDWN